MLACDYTMAGIAVGLGLSRQRVHQYVEDFKKRMTPKQKELAKKHGTPAEFEVAAERTMPAFESRRAIADYEKQWEDAGK